MQKQNCKILWLIACLLIGLLIAVSMLLPDRLSRDLQEQHGLTGTDYQILVELSESPERRNPRGTSRCSSVESALRAYADTASGTATPNIRAVSLTEPTRRSPCRRRSPM